MARTQFLIIGFLVGLVFMNVRLNFGIHGLLIEYIQLAFTLIGTTSVIIFGLALPKYAFKCLTGKE